MANEVIIGRAVTPLGEFGAAFSAAGLGRLSYPDESLDTLRDWARRWEPDAAVSKGDDARVRRLGEELAAYFAGELREFSVPLDMRGTPFQREVWAALVGIPFGETRSYGQLAAALGRPAASRAVGAANGANPVPIIVPCHRVVGSDGKLTGYGGGLPLKRRLLELEGVLTPSLLK